jgi:hypothetical protein
MLLFKYPLLHKKFSSIKGVTAEEAKGEDGFRANKDGISEEEIHDIAFTELLKTGVTDDVSKVVCEDYTEDEITHDQNAVDFEQAYAEVERIEEIKRKEHLKKIQE